MGRFNAAAHPRSLPRPLLATPRPMPHADTDTSDSYHDRRQRLKRAIDTTPGLYLTSVVEELDYTYEYVRQVLRGTPGQRSAPVLDAVEGELRRRSVV